MVVVGDSKDENYFGNGVIIHIIDLLFTNNNYLFWSLIIWELHKYCEEMTEP